MASKKPLNKKTLISISALFAVVILTAASVAAAVGPIGSDSTAESRLESGRTVEADQTNTQLDESGQPIDGEPLTYNKPGEMRAVFLTPGKDFLTSTPMAADKVKSEIDTAIAKAASLTMNTVIIDTAAANSVLYKNDVLPVTSDGLDIMDYIVQKARANNLYVYAVFDALQTYDGAALGHPGAITGQVIDDSCKELESLTQYNVDGVLLRSYYNETTSSSYSDYLRAGGTIGFQNYMAQVPDSVVQRLSDVMRQKAKGVQFGVLTDPVWQNKTQNEEGSDTSAKFTALGSGNADVKSYVENKLVDFVAVEAYGSIADPSVPFETVTKWWSSLCVRQAIDLYVVQASDRMGSSSYAGWSSTDELAKQVTKLRDLDGYSGSIFNSLSQLAANPGGGTDTLLKVFKEEINPDFLFTELTISKPAKTDFTTEERNVTFAGGSDPTQPVTINGKQIQTDNTGFFSVSYELQSGKNTFTIEHKGKTLTYNVTRNVAVLKEIYPVGNLVVDGNMQITITAMAYKGAAVKATLNGAAVTLNEVQNDDDDTNKASSYVKFSGTYTAPAAGAAEKTLGQIVVTGSYEGSTMSLKGALVKVNKLASIADGQPVVVTAAQAETFPTTRLDDLSDPGYYPLPAGVLDYAVGDQIVYKDGDNTYTYYNLASGQRVYANCVSSTGTAAAGNAITGVKVASTGRYTNVTVSTNQLVSYVLRYTSGGITIDFQNTTNTPSGASLSSNPMFSGASWSGTTLSLKFKNGFWGYKATASGNQIVFRFNNPPTIGGAVIVVDAGHGGSDPGAVSFPGMDESEINYAIAEKLVDALRGQGATVKLIGGDTTRVAARVAAAEACNPNLYIAIHNNSASSSSAEGSSAYYFRPWASRLASNVSAGAASGLSTTNRGGSYGLYYVTRVSQYPSVLAECGFMTNQSEFKKLCTSSYQSKVAGRIASAVESYLSGGSYGGGGSDEGEDEESVTGVSLNKSALTLPVGGSETLEATVLPSDADQSVTWKSSNSNVAKVTSGGKVTGVRAGTATITVTTTDGGKTAKCTVTVTDDLTLSLSRSSLSLAADASATLTATVKADGTAVSGQSVSWSTSNSSVATVSSSGTVTGVRAGTATITAALTSDTSVKDTCTVTVSGGTVLVTGITLSPTTLTVAEGESSTIDAAVKPDNASNSTLEWSTSNSSVATVSSGGKVTGVKAGTATITAAATDGSGEKATCHVTVTAGTVPVTGVEVSPSSLSLAVGESGSLSASVSPSGATNSAVRWSSSNTAVARVDSSGNVTAESAGTATITATAADGSGQSGSCRVTVTDAASSSQTPSSSDVSSGSSSTAEATGVSATAGGISCWISGTPLARDAGRADRSAARPFWLVPAESSGFGRGRLASPFDLSHPLGRAAEL